MKEINRIVMVLEQASRNIAATWRAVTFAGILRIPFPVARPVSRETNVEYEPGRTVTFFEPVGGRMGRDSAPSQL